MPMLNFDMSQLPAIVGIETEIKTGHACVCFYAIRHPGKTACEGIIQSPSFRFWFNSCIATPTGVPICRSCAESYPENLELPQ
jgi:hypothetical protein